VTVACERARLPVAQMTIKQSIRRARGLFDPRDPSDEAGNRALALAEPRLGNLVERSARHREGGHADVEAMIRTRRLTGWGA